jgi:hypothetical protein
MKICHATKKMLENHISWDFCRLKVVDNLEASHVDVGIKIVHFPTTHAMESHLKSLPQKWIHHQPLVV